LQGNGSKSKHWSEDCCDSRRLFKDTEFCIPIGCTRTSGIGIGKETKGAPLAIL
jgi:hypothetical protein